MQTEWRASQIRPQKKKLVIFFMQELISFVVVTEMSLFNKQQTAFYAFVVQIAFAYRLTWVLMII